MVGYHKDEFCGDKNEDEINWLRRLIVSNGGL
jgi:hypothetical protein